MVAIDISGRAFFKYSGTELKGSVKTYSEELTLEFLRAFSDNAGINLHVVQKYGDNRHHIHESIFKAFGVAMNSACLIDPSMKGVVPSTKGTIE
jgi:imidazoleglycerol-phosphate dehydratase